MGITYRIFEVGAPRSTATAVTLKDGSLLQVKPDEQAFETLEEWTAAVGLTEGRRLITEGEQPELTADQQRVANAVRKLHSDFHNTRFQPQVTRHSSQTLAEQIEAARVLKHTDELAELEAKALADPASLHAKSYSYRLDGRRVPHLFVRFDGAFLPIYYSADFQWVGIRDMKGDLYKSFAGAGVKGTPQLYAMHPRTHQLWALV